MTDNTEDQLPTEESRSTYTKPRPSYGWQPDGSYITPSTEWFLQQAADRDNPPTQPCDTNEVPPTDWVRQQVLNNRAKAVGYEGTGKLVPLGEGWSTTKLAPPPPKQMLATTGWVNERIEVEIAKEKDAFYRFLLFQTICLVVGILIGMLWI